MIDWHTHILPSVDDGAVTTDEALAIARSLADFGYQAACCTPHCMKGYYELSPEKVREATLMLQADLDNAGIHIELIPGMEYMLDEFLADYAADFQPLGDTRLILCEAPQDAVPEVVLDGLKLILDKGFVPLVAHPERSDFFYEILMTREARDATKENADIIPPHKEDGAISGVSPGFLKKLFSKKKTAPRAPRHAPRADELPVSVLYHANLGSFTGYYGPEAQTRAYDLLKRGVYTALATDLHNSDGINKVLHREKLETNPLLQKLADFDGDVPPPPDNTQDPDRQDQQGNLF